MGFRFTYITSTLFAFVWLTLIACATTPPPSVPLPTATTILADQAYPPPPPPPANPNLILTPTSILTVIVAEVHTVDDHLELAIYPSSDHPYSMVELSPGTLVVQAAALAPSGVETPTTFEAIKPNARLGVVGYEQTNTENNTVHFVAREVVIMELDASLLTPTPAPQWGEPGYPAPITLQAEEVVAPLSTPTMALPPMPPPCLDCDVMHMVALVTAEAPAQDIAEEAIFTVVSATEYGYWFVRVDGETEITFEDWSPATVEDISVDSMIDVVGPLWGGGYLGAQYIIILDPATNPPPIYDPENPVPSAYP